MPDEGVLLFHEDFSGETIDHYKSFLELASSGFYQRKSIIPLVKRDKKFLERLHQCRSCGYIAKYKTTLDRHRRICHTFKSRAIGRDRRVAAATRAREKRAAAKRKNGSRGKAAKKKKIDAGPVVHNLAESSESDVDAAAIEHSVEAAASEESVEEDDAPATFENAIRPGWLVATTVCIADTGEVPYSALQDRFIMIKLPTGWHFAKVYQLGRSKGDKGVVYVLCDGADNAGSFTFHADRYLHNTDQSDTAEEGSWVFVEEMHFGRRSRRNAG